MKTLAELNPTQSQMFTMLYAEYKTMSLKKSQASKAMNVSVSTLDELRKAGKGCAYKQDTPLSNVYYPLTTIVEYLTTDLVGA